MAHQKGPLTEMAVTQKQKSVWLDRFNACAEPMSRATAGPSTKIGAPLQKKNCNWRLFGKTYNGLFGRTSGGKMHRKNMQWRQMQQRKMQQRKMQWRKICITKKESTKKGTIHKRWNVQKMQRTEVQQLHHITEHPVSSTFTHFHPLSSTFINIIFA